MYMNEWGSTPVKLYLQKWVTREIWPPGPSLPRSLESESPVFSSGFFAGVSTPRSPEAGLALLWGRDSGEAGRPSASEGAGEACECTDHWHHSIFPGQCFVHIRHKQNTVGSNLTGTSYTLLNKTCLVTMKASAY